jgi:hypothetical protein
MVSPSTPPPPAQAHTHARDVRAALWDIYVRAMRRYRTADGLLARSIERTDDGWVVHESCALNTAEMLKAAQLMAIRGLPHPFDLAALMTRMKAQHLETADQQVASLMLWAAAIGEHPDASAWWKRLREADADETSQSMTLAWMLSSLCEYVNGAPDREDVTRFASRVFTRLVENQDHRSGLFYASARREGLLRRRVPDATLSSQTYPILALAAYAGTFEARAALDHALSCADRLCRLQGDRGQWWRRYDARRGTVHTSYPVYCTNQDSAVPAALGMLQRALGDTRYDGAIEKGLGWITGNNEAGRTLIDADGGFVAESLERRPDGTPCTWDMHAYQPARFVFAVLSNPTWASEVVR